MDNKLKNVKKAFKWIILILRKHKVPFQITGGLAARIYGSNRQLYDIDIEIPEDQFNIILGDIKNYVIYGPKRYKNNSFDLKLMTLKYSGQKIDISGSQTLKLFDKKRNIWVPMKVDHNKFVKKKVYGLVVSVETKKSLVSYKKIIARKEDIEDIVALSSKS